jgi:hypothetical protein
VELQRCHVPVHQGGLPSLCVRSLPPLIRVLVSARVPLVLEPRLLCLGFCRGTFAPTQHNNVYILGVTKKNSNVTMILAFLSQLVVVRGVDSSADRVAPLPRHPTCRGGTLTRGLAPT